MDKVFAFMKTMIEKKHVYIYICLKTRIHYNNNDGSDIVQMIPYWMNLLIDEVSRVRHLQRTHVSIEWWKRPKVER